MDDALAGADGVAGELDALVGLPGAPRLGDGRRGHDAPPFQVALDPYPVVSTPSTTWAASPRRRAMSSWTARISRRRSATGSGRRRLSASIARDASTRVAADDEARRRAGGRAGAGSAAGARSVAVLPVWWVGGDRSWPRQGAARGAVKPWSVRTREATRRAGLDGPACAPCYGWRTRPITTRAPSPSAAVGAVARVPTRVRCRRARRSVARRGPWLL